MTFLLLWLSLWNTPQQAQRESCACAEREVMLTAPEVRQTRASRPLRSF